VNKFVKGSIAAAAATVLLLGGAGSLAYWNDTAGLHSTDKINAGKLELVAADGNWAPEIVKWVPGDASTYATTLTLTADGDHIAGDLAFDEASIIGSITAAGSADPATIRDQFEFTFDLDPAEADLPAGATLSPNGANTFSFDGAGTYTIPVEVTVAFLFDEGDQNDSMLATLDLSAITFTATQTAP